MTRTDFDVLSRLLTELETRPSTAHERARLEAALVGSVPNVPSSIECPHCGVEDVSAQDAVWHFVRCSLLPARRAFNRWQRIALALGDVEVPHIELVAEAHDDFAAYIRDHISSLSAEPQPHRANSIACVRRELSARLHAYDRSTDPCPWCAEVFPLETVRAHLSNCVAHPAARAAASLQSALENRQGVAELLASDRVHEANVELERLFEACDRYHASMGWSGGSVYYSKVWSEKPWRRELHRADVFVKNERLHRVDGALDEVLASISHVTKSSWSFWNGMSDGDRGESLIKDENCKRWLAELSSRRSNRRQR